MHSIPLFHVSNNNVRMKLVEDTLQRMGELIRLTNFACMQAMQMVRKGDVVFAMDPRLRRSPASIDAVKKVLKLASQCLASLRESRPSMKKCAEVLWGIRKSFRDEAIPHPPLPSHLSENFPQREKNKHMSFGIEDDDSYKFASAPNPIHL